MASATPAEDGHDGIPMRYGRRSRIGLAWVAVAVALGPLPSPAASASVTVVRPPYVFRAFRWEKQQVRVLSLAGSPGVAIEMRLARRTFGSRRPTSRIGTSAGAVAATNGGFTLSALGAPRHLTVVRGEILTSGALWTQRGVVLSMTADRTQAWIGPARLRITATASAPETEPLGPFEIESWNARQPSSSRVVAFTARGGDRVEPSVLACWAVLEPVSGARAAHRVYTVTQVDASAACDRPPIAPPRGRFDVVVLGGGQRTVVGALTVGATVTMDVDLGHPGVTDVFGGLPRLVDDGVNVGPACFSECGPKHGPDRPFYARNPRTAVGITIGCSDEDPLTPCRYLLVTVDGRQPGWSTGLRFPALGRLMLELGAWNAVNLDGGGSTTMWVRTRNPACERRTRVGCLVNRPPYGERSVIDAVVVRTR